MSRTDRVITPSETSPPYHVGMGRALWNEAARRLQPDHPAAGRWNADGARTICSVGHRHHAGRNRPGRGPSRRAAGGAACEIEGIACRTEKKGFAGHVEAEFGKIGLAKNAQARLLETYRQFVVKVLRRHGKEGAAGAARALACNACADVFQKERHAGERASRRRIFYRFLIKIDNGVDFGVLFLIRATAACKTSALVTSPARISAASALASCLA